ncbi:hypothetical protein ACHAQE_008803 [Botrytis cinerea]
MFSSSLPLCQVYLTTAPAKNADSNIEPSTQAAVVTKTISIKVDNINPVCRETPFSVSTSSPKVSRSILGYVNIEWNPRSKGFIRNSASKKVARMRLKLDIAGRAIVQESDWPRPSAVMILIITRTRISSNIAAPAIKVPIGVFCRFADERIMNVDPKDVEQRETPAEKAANAVGYPEPSILSNSIPMMENERAIGIRIPIIAAGNVTHIVLLNI